mmetsp:Transcript_19430/g.27362  ORF Transcript_19430/g.27362 Transcript_19430/m.27362 type:complete len:100 (+) Transcript_19430:35-334(+)
MFTRLQEGLEPMKAANDGFAIEIDGETSMSVTIGAAGAYQFTSDSKKKELQMFSPISTNVYYYTYDESKLEWVNVNDGHYMVELLTRELLTSCSGLPEF